MPMITDRKACERIIRLLNENAKIRANPNKRKSMPVQLIFISRLNCVPDY